LLKKTLSKKNSSSQFFFLLSKTKTGKKKAKMSFMRNNNNNKSSNAAAAASTESSASSLDRKPPKPINIRTILHEDGLVIKGLPKNKVLPDNEVKLPLLWKVHNKVTNQDKIQITNFLIGDTSLKVANQVSKKPGPFTSKDSRGKITTPQPNKYSMLIRVGDEEMIEVFRRLDETIKQKIREGNLLVDYRITADRVDDCYKPFLIETGGGDYSISTTFNVNADGTAEDKELIDVRLMIVSRDPVTGEIENSLQSATVDDIRMGDSVIIEGGFDGIRLDKMTTTSDGLPRIGFKHYARRIIVVRTTEDQEEEDEEDADAFLLAAASGKTFNKAATAVKVGEKRDREDDDADNTTAASSSSSSSSTSTFFKRG
jgi:hypothetical protein